MDWDCDLTGAAVRLALSLVNSQVQPVLQPGGGFKGAARLSCVNTGQAHRVGFVRLLDAKHDAFNIAVFGLLQQRAQGVDRVFISVRA